MTWLALANIDPLLPLSELECIHSLPALQTLHIRSVFSTRIDEQQRGAYSVPSALMPSLRQFACSS